MSPWTARGPPALLLPPVLVRVQVLLLLLAAAPAAGKVSAGRRHPHPAHRNSHPPSWGHARSTRRRAVLETLPGGCGLHEGPSAGSVGA